MVLKLSRMKGDAKKEVQASFFETDIQTEIDFASTLQKRQMEELEFQIHKVDHEISQISTKNLPFIWRIDFPEIFIEKGGFDLVIGNPPYVAQEEIEDPLGSIGDNKKYKELLRQMVNQDFPQDIPVNVINGKSDLYTFFYIRGLRLLNENGILTYICSNSWLDVEFGAWLQKFLLDRCQIHFIIDNLAKRAFKEAGINTIISLIGARQKMVRADDLIRFAAFKLPFENSLYTENFLMIEDAKKRIEIDDLRINPVTREQLSQEGWENSKENKYLGSMWGGFYLRAPQIMIDILDKCKTKLCNLSKLAVIKGYIHDNSLGDQYTKRRYVKSVKDVSLLGIDIESQGVKDQGIKSSNSNDLISPILFPRTLGSRHLVIRNLGKVYFKEFYKIIPISTDMSDSIFAQLNSSFSIFQREILGLSNLGDGAIKFSIQSIGLFKLIPGLTSLDFDEVIEPLLSQPIDDIHLELAKSHRIELDDIVFSYLGLTKQERIMFMDLLYSTIENRLSRAKTKDS